MRHEASVKLKKKNSEQAFKTIDNIFRKKEQARAEALEAMKAEAEANIKSSRSKANAQDK